LVSGVQTAVVVGPSGEEIFCDEFGRVKVQFHWDREGKKDEKSSCWIRVSHNIAGKQWGFVILPRMGQEVVVDFEEGDPDRPLIVGMVYNAEQMPPYTLPDNKTQSGFKSRSSKGGSPANFNEIRFEDKKGSEQVFIHAEKNQDIEVENDETHWVGHDRTKTIDNDETTHVKHDRTETVDNNETITIHGARKEEVDKNETITIHGARTETVDKDEKITIHGGRTEVVDKNESISIGGSRKETVSKDESVSIQGARSHNVTKDDTLAVGKNLSVTAADSISLTTGKASIVMKKDGTITISGKDITITGKGKIIGKASKDMVLKGKKILQN
jgi:type VI secretion system secreted protein VgrG